MFWFAQTTKRQQPLWFSLSTRDNPPLGVDACAPRPWPRMLLYAFPAIPLIPQFLDRVQEEQLSAILIAPERTGASWFHACSGWYQAVRGNSRAHYPGRDSRFYQSVLHSRMDRFSALVCRRELVSHCVSPVSRAFILPTVGGHEFDFQHS